MGVLPQALLCLGFRHAMLARGLPAAGTAGRWGALSQLATAKPLEPEQWDPSPSNPWEEGCIQDRVRFSESLALA